MVLFEHITRVILILLCDLAVKVNGYEKCSTGLRLFFCTYGKCFKVNDTWYCKHSWSKVTYDALAENSSRDTYLHVFVTSLSFTGIAFIILIYAATLRNRHSSGQEPEQKLPQQQSEDINNSDLVCHDIDKVYNAGDIVLEIAADRFENSNSKTLLASVDFSSDLNTQEPYVVIHSASLLKCNLPADHISTTKSLVTLI